MRRAFRVDKTTLAALDAVLSLYLAGREETEVPTVRQLALGLDELEERAVRLLDLMRPAAPAGWQGTVAPGRSSVGGGSFSCSSVESRLVQWTGPKEELEACHQQLRRGDPALVGRMNQDGLAVDVRTIDEDELELAAQAFAEAWAFLELSRGEAGK